MDNPPGENFIPDMLTSPSKNLNDYYSVIFYLNIDSRKK